MRLIFCAIFLASAFSPNVAQVFPQPEQVHLSIGDSVLEVVVTWVTMTQTNDSVVEYGKSGYEMRATGTETPFVDGGSEKRILYIHRVKIANLQPLTRYVYHCGGQQGWSAQFNFKTMESDTKWSPRFAMFGDMGNINARSLARLQEETQLGHFDMILHVGDLAYNMDTNNARYGDEFMRQVESIAAYVPYMTCPGNHEQAYNFSNYKARFTMPGGDGLGNFYSFNVGPVHFIYYNLEYYYYTNYGWRQIVNQYLWLEKDLKEANKPENRARRPWIIAMAHRPMYCSNSNDPEHCPNHENKARVGFPFSNQGVQQYMFGLEDLFYEQGVDMIVAAHEHSYERMWPVYNWTVCNGTSSPYVNPPAPIHVVTGSAGCQEHLDPFKPGGQPWSAFRDSDYGYTRMQVVNATHLYFEQMNDAKGIATDSAWIIKAKHGSGLYSCHTQNPFVLAQEKGKIIFRKKQK